MRTLLLILIQVLLFTLLAFWYQQNPGMLEVTWLGYRFEMSIAIFIILTTALITVLYLVVRLLLNIIHIPSFFRARYAKYNQMKGIHAIEDSLVAYLAQDAKLLKKTSSYVGSFLKHSPLNFFFRAEAALMGHDLEKAHALFTLLTKHDAMAFAGHSGLMRLALAHKKIPRAIAHGDCALAQNPNALSIRKKIMNLSLTTKDYGRALRELDILLKASPRSISLAKKKAGVLYDLAKEAQSKNEFKGALSLVEKSLKLIPNNADTLFVHVQILRQLGKEKAAAKALEKAWQIAPQETFISLYLKTKSVKTPQENFKAIQRLVSFAPDHPESDLALARFALKAQLHEPAKEALQRLTQQGGHQSAVHLLQDELKKLPPKK